MLSFLLMLVIVVVLLNILMFFQQPKMIFFPSKDMNQNPAGLGYKYEDVYLTTGDEVKLHGWYIPRDHSNKVILFLHGNAGNISHRLDSIKIFHQLRLNIFIFDYRGYGRSEGQASERGLYTDARSAWDYLVNQKQFKPENIIIFGRSLGGAVATNLTSQVQPAGLILESTFSSARDMADRLMPFLSNVLFLRYGFDSTRQIRQSDSPLLVMHSPDDEIIPFKLGEKLFRSAKEPKFFHKLRGDHNSGFFLSQPEYQQTIQKFLLSISDS